MAQTRGVEDVKIPLYVDQLPAFKQQHGSTKSFPHSSRILGPFKALSIVVLFVISFVTFRSVPTPDIVSVDPVEGALRAAPLTDTHDDFPIWVRAFYKNHIYGSNFTNTSKLIGMVDFPRLAKGGLRAQFWSVYVECPKDSGNFSDEVYGEAVHDTLQQIDLVYRLVGRFSDNLQIARTAADVWSQFTSSGRISSLMGAEGLHQIANSASILRTYYQLGVRYITLTHSCHNRYADSCGPSKPLHYGLSKSGVAIIQEMNRIGMIVDISHTSHDAQRQAIKTSRAPVLFSHSNVYAICDNPRNVPDDVLLQLKQNRGVIMITFVPDFIKCKNSQDATLLDVADHIEHVGKLIGYEHVGLGADFDGIPYGPKGLEDVSKYPDLLGELVRRGITQSELEGIVGRNVFRLLAEVEAVAKTMDDVQPLEDDVKDVFLV